MKIQHKRSCKLFILRATQLTTEWEFKLLMAWLFDNPDSHPSSTMLGHRINRTKRRVNEILKSLVTKGILICQTTPGFANTYEPNMNIVWSQFTPDQKKSLLRPNRTRTTDSLSEANKELWETTIQEETTIYN